MDEIDVLIAEVRAELEKHAVPANPATLLRAVAAVAVTARKGMSAGHIRLQLDASKIGARLDLGPPAL